MADHASRDLSSSNMANEMAGFFNLVYPVLPVVLFSPVIAESILSYAGP